VVTKFGVTRSGDYTVTVDGERPSGQISSSPIVKMQVKISSRQSGNTPDSFCDRDRTCPELSNRGSGRLPTTASAGRAVTQLSPAVAATQPRAAIATTLPRSICAMCGRCARSKGSGSSAGGSLLGQGMRGYCLILASVTSRHRPAQLFLAAGRSVNEIDAFRIATGTGRAGS
jgi:hypothetical protein